MRRRTGVRAALLACLLLVLGTHSFAAPVPGQVHFTAVGDISASGNASAVLNKINDLDSDLTQTLGDLSYGAVGQEASWCQFVTDRVGEGYAFELLSGNHESGGQNGNINDFSACLPNQLPGVVGTYGRQYYVDVPQDDPIVRFVQISPALTFPDGTWSYTPGSARYNWTAAAIDGARSASIPWVVVSLHKPCITLGNYACDPGVGLYNMLLDKRVDLILNGHEHTYQRSHQLATGTGCTTLTLEPAPHDPDCIVDSDTNFVAGAGSVVGVVGTGGVGFYDVDPTDSEAGYFGAVSGANNNPTFGVLDVKATDNSLQANFVRAAGGTFTDSFTITKGAQNTPPVAAFTSNCTQLACAFDGSGSSDPDGSIAGYAWNFGDGSTGSGVNASHTYAAAGTYPVSLTVTDNGGAPTTLTKNVTVTGGGVTSYVSDQFSRTVSGGFGTAPTGGAWTHTGGNTNFSVAGGQGSIRIAAGGGPAAYLASVDAPATDLTTAFALDKVPTGSGLYTSIIGRRNAAGTYFAKVRVTSTGAITLELCRRTAAGAETVVQSAVTVPGTYTAGETLRVRLQVTGTSPTTLRAKVWEGGASEPAAWQRSVTDSTAGFQTSGSVGITPYLSSSATNAPIILSIDELSVTAP